MAMMRGKKLCWLFFLSCLLIVCATTLVMGKQDPELKQCMHQCKHQEKYDETQQRECEEDCVRYYQEKQKRREREQGGGQRGIFDVEEEWNPRRGSPIEKLRQCESRCETQRRKEGGHRECQQKCFDEFKREQEKGQGSSDDTTYNYGGREEEEEEEVEENNPYVFEDQHFTAQLRTEHGSVRILQKFTERSKLLRGIENYRVVILEADPRTFVVPNHWDADSVFFVAQGEGTLSLVRPQKRESFNIRRGDVVRVPAGITAYLINRHNNQKLVLAKLFRPVSTPGNFEAFFGTGGDNPESFYKAFSTEILEAAFNTRRDRLEKIFGQQRQGIIIKASEEQIRAMSRHEEGGHWPFGGESKGPFNLLDKRPDSSNQYGSVRRVDADDLRQLEDLDMAVAFMNITQGAMAGPLYESKSTKIAVVLSGEGYLEMACPHLSQQAGGSRRRGGSTGQTTPSYQKVRSRLRRGTVVVVPAGHPIAVVASNNDNLELIGFEVNAKNSEKMPLAGKRNVISQMEREAMELAFGVSGRQVEEVFSSQEEEFFFKGPRQQGRAEM